MIARGVLALRGHARERVEQRRVNAGVARHARHLARGRPQQLVVVASECRDQIRLGFVSLQPSQRSNRGVADVVVRIHRQPLERSTCIRDRRRHGRRTCAPATRCAASGRAAAPRDARVTASPATRARATRAASCRCSGGVRASPIRRLTTSSSPAQLPSASIASSATCSFGSRQHLHHRPAAVGLRVMASVAAQRLVPHRVFAVRQPFAQVVQAILWR